MTEIFKTKLGINTELMNETFDFNNSSYYFRNRNTLKRENVHTVKYGRESIKNLGAKIWDLVPQEYKMLDSISSFKNNISHWTTEECPCRLCKKYIQNLGFI